MTHDVGFLDDLLPEDRRSTDEAIRDGHAADWGGEQAGMGVRPDAVVFPITTAEVSEILAAANDRGVPVTPYAAGTALEGHVVPAEKGISMDLTRMNEIGTIRPGDFQIDVQPGVIGSSIDEALERHGLFFPPLPSSGSISTIGGMIATDASGMQTVKYGEVADWVLAMEVVLADGRVIEVGSTAAKTSSGYNLKDLLIGSEGTLGVVTNATLELAGVPEQIRGGRAIFPSLEAAASAVMDAVQSGVDVAKIELVDDLAAAMAELATQDEEYAQLSAKRLAHYIFDVYAGAVLLAEAQTAIDDRGDGRLALVARRFVERALADSEARGITGGDRFPIEHFDAVVRYASVDPDEIDVDA